MDGGAQSAPSGRSWLQVMGGERLLLALVAVYVLAVCVLPLLRLLSEVFAPGAGGLDLVREVLESRSTQRATWHTLEAGLASTVLSVLLGGGAAMIVALTDVRAKPAIVFLLLLPLLIPAQVAALAWLELIGPSSVIYQLVGYDPQGWRNPLYSREGVVLLLGIEHAPMVFLAVRAGLRGIPRDLVEAARASGASAARITWSIILPMARPAVIAGAALAFVSAIGNFGVPALLGIPGRYTMLTTLVYQRLNGFGPSVLGEIAILAVILTLMAATGLAIQALALRRGIGIERSGLTGPVFALKRRRVPVEAGLWVLLTLIAILPMVALVATSIRQASGVDLSWATVTFDHYAFALSAPETARGFTNSFFLALAAATLSIAVAIPLGYLSLHRGSRVARALEFLTDAPYALPGIVLSIAVILVYLRPLPLVDISLYNTFFILLVAYFGRFLALGVRPVLSGLEQVDRALDEAAEMAGAGVWRRLTRVVLPLVGPAAAAGGVLIFLAAFNELTVSALLWSTGNETIGVRVFALYDQGDSSAAAAVAVLTVIATLAIAGLVSLLARRLPYGVLPWQAS